MNGRRRSYGDPAMVDSYEIYGDNQDESELEDENFIN